MFVYDKVVEEDKRDGDAPLQGEPGPRPGTLILTGYHFRYQPC